MTVPIFFLQPACLGPQLPTCLAANGVLIIGVSAVHIIRIRRKRLEALNGPTATARAAKFARLYLKNAKARRIDTLAQSSFPDEWPKWAQTQLGGQTLMQKLAGDLDAHPVGVKMHNNDQTGPEGGLTLDGQTLWLKLGSDLESHLVSRLNNKHLEQTQRGGQTIRNGLDTLESPLLGPGIHHERLASEYTAKGHPSSRTPTVMSEGDRLDAPSLEDASDFDWRSWDVDGAGGGMVSHGFEGVGDNEADLGGDGGWNPVGTADDGSAVAIVTPTTPKTRTIIGELIWDVEGVGGAMVPFGFKDFRDDEANLGVDGGWNPVGTADDGSAVAIVTTSTPKARNAIGGSTWDAEGVGAAMVPWLEGIGKNEGDLDLAGGRYLRSTVDFAGTTGIPQIRFVVPSTLQMWPATGGSTWDAEGVGAAMVPWLEGIGKNEGDLDLAGGRYLRSTVGFAGTTGIPPIRFVVPSTLQMWPATAGSFHLSPGGDDWARADTAMVVGAVADVAQAPMDKVLTFPYTGRMERVLPFAMDDNGLPELTLVDIALTDVVRETTNAGPLVEKDFWRHRSYDLDEPSSTSAIAACVLFVFALLLAGLILLRRRKRRRRCRERSKERSKTGVTAQAIVASVDFSRSAEGGRDWDSGETLPLVLLGGCAPLNQGTSPRHEESVPRSLGDVVDTSGRRLVGGFLHGFKQRDLWSRQHEGTPHTTHHMAVQALEGQAAAARAMAYEAAASLRSTAFVSRMGIDLGPDVLLGFRLVLVKLGSGPLTQLGQKTLSSLPIAYAACTIKEHKQMPSAERDKQMTTTLMEFAIPHFILLLKQAARELDLPPPCDFERKLYLTTLGTGTGKAKTYAEMPKTAWVRFANKIKPEYTRDIQIHFDMGPQNESDFPSGLNSKDMLDKLREAVWQESAEATKLADTEAIDLTPDAGTPVRAVASPGGMVGGRAAGAALHETRVRDPVPVGGGVSPGGGAATEEGRGGVGGGNIGGAVGGVFNTRTAGGGVSDGAAGGVGPTWAAGGGVSDGVERGGVPPLGAAAGAVPDDGAAPAAAAPVRRARKDKAASPPMPEGWIFPYILMACAWPPWSNNTPGEWKNLCVSGGKVAKRKLEDQIKIEAENPLASPEAMAVGSPVGSRALTRVNSDGQPSSRRKSLAAVKEEAALAGKAHKENKDKENMAMAKESMETQKDGVAAMMDANDNARKIAGEMKRMVTLREEETCMKREEATAAKRARKIAALEKRNALAGGRDANIVAQLDALLDEECNA